MKHVRKFRQSSEANSKQMKAHKIEKAETNEPTPSRIKLELLKLEVANNLSKLLLMGEEYETGPKSL